jgi:hypothetical protein
MFKRLTMMYQELIDQVGPGAFYWITDIADQMPTLAATSMNGFHAQTLGALNFQY